jgi:hypothetical protein
MPSAAAVAVLQVIRPDRRRRVILWHAYPLAEQMRADQLKGASSFRCSVPRPADATCIRIGWRDI